jgi:hypothetical protein
VYLSLLLLLLKKYDRKATKQEKLSFFVQIHKLKRWSENTFRVTGLTFEKKPKLYCSFELFGKQFWFFVLLLLKNKLKMPQN